jgi:hypothetical protein
MAWTNSDTLYVKFGNEESASARGGEYATTDQGRHVIEFTIDWKDVQSTSAVILGGVATVANPQIGSYGVQIPEGFIPEQMETTALVAFTSSGTIGTSTMVIGTVKASDRTTALNLDAFTTTAFVGSVFDATNENVVVKTGVTGVGDGYGIASTENGLVVVANSQHASHPYTAGVLKCRLIGRFGLASV